MKKPANCESDTPLKGFVAASSVGDSNAHDIFFALSFSYLRRYREHTHFNTGNVTRAKYPVYKKIYIIFLIIIFEDLSIHNPTKEFDEKKKKQNQNFFSNYEKPLNILAS